VTHQSQGATWHGSEFIRLEQRGQSGRSDELYTIKVHDYDARHGELREQTVAQFQTGRTVYPARYRDHPGVGPGLNYPQAEIGGKSAACRHTRHNISDATTQFHVTGSELLSGGVQSVCGTA
jgi:hypothetical protein